MTEADNFVQPQQISDFLDDHSIDFLFGVSLRISAVLFVIARQPAGPNHTLHAFFLLGFLFHFWFSCLLFVCLLAGSCCFFVCLFVYCCRFLLACLLARFFVCLSVCLDRGVHPARSFGAEDLESSDACEAAVADSSSHEGPDRQGLAIEAGPGLSGR